MTKVRLVKEFADCCVRSCLTAQQSAELESARDGVAAAILRLIEVYGEMPVIKNGKTELDLGNAVSFDIEKLCRAAVDAHRRPYRPPQPGR